MASSVVGALRVVLGLDSAEFTSGINRANRATGQFAKQGKTFEKATRGMSTALRGQIGREAWRERVGQDVYSSGVAVSLQKKHNKRELSRELDTHVHTNK